MLDKTYYCTTNYNGVLLQAATELLRLS